MQPEGKVITMRFKWKSGSTAARQSARANRKLLLQAVLQCIDSAQKQVERSRRLVAETRAIIAKAKKSLEYAHRIRPTMTAEHSKNRLIARARGNGFPS